MLQPQRHSRYRFVQFRFSCHEDPVYVLAAIFLYLWRQFNQPYTIFTQPFLMFIPHLAALVYFILDLLAATSEDMNIEQEPILSYFPVFNFLTVQSVVQSKMKTQFLGTSIRWRDHRLINTLPLNSALRCIRELQRTARFEKHLTFAYQYFVKRVWYTGAFYTELQDFNELIFVLCIRFSFYVYCGVSFLAQRFQ